MTEWGVVGVIVVLLGLVAAIAKPLLGLNTTLIKVSTQLESLGGSLKELTEDNKKSHERLWRHNDKQDGELDDHEHRITVLEHTDKC